MRKAIREGLKFLGKDYRLYYIDLSDCIYRDLGDFDIEVEYVSNRKLSPKTAQSPAPLLGYQRLPRVPGTFAD